MSEHLSNAQLQSDTTKIGNYFHAFVKARQNGDETAAQVALKAGQAIMKLDPYAGMLLAITEASDLTKQDEVGTADATV